ncbi:MAG: helix-turn-helix domain-containing protein [Bradymonadaceae bacterium]|nr:helix-turn-helix domain-containing protein [Lujinxingiaceae bacterium]
MNLDKEVYTTFEVAKICNANITSIKNWIEQGELRAFRTPGGHYRVERKVLDDFLNRHGMPNPFAMRERRRVLLVHRDHELLVRLRGQLGESHDYDSTADPVDALLKIGQWKPDAAVIDVSIGGIDAVGLCQRVRAHAELRPVDLIIVHNFDEPFDQSVRDAGANYTVKGEASEGAIIEAVRRALL